MKTAFWREIIRGGGIAYPKAKLQLCLTAGIWVLLGAITCPVRLEALTCNAPQQVFSFPINTANDHIAVDGRCGTQPSTIQMYYLAYGPSGFPNECGDNFQLRPAILPFHISQDTVVGGLNQPMIPKWQGVCADIYLVALAASPGCDPSGHCIYHFKFGNPDGTPWEGPFGPAVFDPQLGSGNIFSYEFYLDATGPTITSVTPGPGTYTASSSNLALNTNRTISAQYDIQYSLTALPGSTCGNGPSGSWTNKTGAQTGLPITLPTLSGCEGTTYQLFILVKDTLDPSNTSLQSTWSGNYTFSAASPPSCTTVGSGASCDNVTTCCDGNLGLTCQAGTCQTSLPPTSQPPVITSALSASGIVGTVFNYYINATNSPANFNATGLPAGLLVNTGNGLISGTPTTAGTSNVTISASNAAGTGYASLTITISPATGTTRPDPPTVQFLGCDADNKGVTFSYSSPSPATVYYPRVDYFPQAVSGQTPIYSADAITATTMHIPNLPASTDLQFWVHAGNGGTSWTTDISEQTTVRFRCPPLPYTRPPTVESNNIADPSNPNANTDHTITLAVYPVSTNIPPPNSVEVQYTSPNSDNQVVANGPIDASGIAQIKVLGLPSNTKYSGLTARFGSYLPGVASLTGDPLVSPTTLSTPDYAWTKPTAPNTPAFTSATATDLTGSFVFPNNPAGTQYLIEVRTDNGTTSTPVKTAGPVTGTVGANSPFTITGLTVGQTYYFRIRAKSAYNSSFDVFSGPLPHNFVIPPVPYDRPSQVHWKNDPDPIYTDASKFTVEVFSGLANSAPPLYVEVQYTGPNGQSSQIIQNQASNPALISISDATNVPPNSQFTGIQARFRSNNGAPDTDDVMSPWSTTQNVVAWTKPLAPAAGPQISNVTLNSITTKFIFPNNPTGTKYDVEVVPTDTPNAEPIKSDLITQGTAGALSPDVTFTTLAPGTAYNLVVRAISSHNAPFDTFSPITPLFTPGVVKVISFTASPSVSLDDILFGVQANSPVKAVFNVPIDILTVQLTIKQITENGANTIPVSPPTLNGTTLSITPQSGSWAYNAVYQVDLAPGVADSYHLRSTQSAFSTYFVTAPNVGALSTIVSPLDTTRRTARVEAPANALPPGGFAVPRVAFRNPSRPLTAGAFVLNLNAQGTIRVLSRAEVDIFKTPTDGDYNSPLDIPVRLTMTVPSNNSNALRSVLPDTLQIYTLSANGKLVPVLGSVLNSDGSMTAPITQSGVYFIAGVVPTQLSGAYAYPVPFRPASGHTVITFKNLATDTTIKIYTITGELVKQLDPNTVAPDLTNTWTVKNTDGDNVASGVYIYQIKNSYSEKRGKLVIIR